MKTGIAIENSEIRPGARTADLPDRGGASVVLSFPGTGAKATTSNSFLNETMASPPDDTQVNDAAKQGCGTPDRQVTKGRRLTILYGTESGNADEVARSVAHRAAAGDLNPLVVGMADYSLDQLAQELDVLIVTSTTGEGDPPYTALRFFDFVEGPTAPNLEGVRFAVLGLGDSTYQLFCAAGKRLDHRFAELGATRLVERVDCDIDYVESASSWTDTILNVLGASLNQVARNVPATAGIDPTERTYDKHKPFPATVLKNDILVGQGSTKATRHIAFSLAESGLQYEPGDSLGVFVTNHMSDVSAILDATGLAADAAVEIDGQTVTLSSALLQYQDITSMTPRFLDWWIDQSGSDDLRSLRLEEHLAQRTDFLRTHHVVDTVRQFPAVGLTAQGFLSHLRRLQPRLYSIASSMALVHAEVHLTVSPVAYQLFGESRIGIASRQLSERSSPGVTLPIYVQPSPHFRLPIDDAPIIMIGAGTGVAPYRAFLQEREARGNAGLSWLFFGERNMATDFIYREEWARFLQRGTLKKMDTAFSRDGSNKIYVQHRMLERAVELYSWIRDGAHVYICGDATHLAPDVDAALTTIVADGARTTREVAQTYIRDLQNEHRYHRDVY